jgi:DNA-binding response OmpR family regulator
MLESRAAQSGKAYDALKGKSIKTKRPDLIILDVMKPRKDG